MHLFRIRIHVEREREREGERVYISCCSASMHVHMRSCQSKKLLGIHFWLKFPVGNMPTKNTIFDGRFGEYYSVFRPPPQIYSVCSNARVVFLTPDYHTTLTMLISAPLSALLY